ncbi:DUF3987 domain-containing protein [Desulfonatronum thiodismutans]|uniref:DUF3987 domain-containing protein n=1 Tax=Desulfonatronum thiodismutans TaxID=159290 RepID=UPI0004ABDDBA|nr:DUF3987 domain-containing protein [Desulfonatronum thiodismutans]
MTFNRESILPIQQAAKAYSQAGLSVISVDAKLKTPKGPWKRSQAQALTPQEIDALNFEAVAIVAGKVSGGLECLDFDHKAAFGEEWRQLVEAVEPGLVAKLTRQRTQSGGRHVVYRVEGATIPGNAKLAHDNIPVPGPGKHEFEGKPYTAQEDGGKWFIHPCMIETRGEGGYFLADPSPGYELMGGSFQEIVTISKEQWETLIRAARFLDRLPAKPKQEPRQADDQGDRPGDQFNEQGDPWPILERHGWTKAGITKGDREWLRRPGKDSGWSASLNGGKVLMVFSTNAAPFEAEQSYSPFAIFALLEHGGDFAAAARALKNAGCAGTKNNRHSQEPNNGNGFASNAGYAGCSGIIQEKCDHLPPPPLHCFHPDVAHLIKEVAIAKSAPIEAAIAPLLAVVAAMIGRAMGLKIKTGWVEYGNLYLALVALSGSGKSPVTSFFFRLVRKLERQFQKRFEEALERYELELLQWGKESKRKDTVPGPKPEKPRREDILVDDWTVESLTDTLAVNPFGILAYRDELAGLLLELDKYSNGPGGGTKNRLMSAYDSGPWKTSRINQSRVSYVPNACISLYGTIQPVQAKDIFTGSDKATGFLSRFLMINAAIKAPSYFNERSESFEAINTIERLINGLYKIRKEERA